ncbi:MAG: hypothetical protein WDN03_08850 [Rhizomicrobium sp.]
MPDVAGARRQGHAVGFALTVAVEQAKLDRLGVCREQREVYACPVERRAQRFGPALFQHCPAGHAPPPCDSVPASIRLAAFEIGNHVIDC